MSFNTYELGELVSCSAEFTASDTGSFLDPTVVKLTVRSPDVYKRTHTYGSDTIDIIAPDGTASSTTVGSGYIVRESIGNYHAEVRAALPATWHSWFHPTGSGQASNEKFFTVRNPHAA